MLLRKKKGQEVEAKDLAQTEFMNRVHHRPSVPRHTKCTPKTSLIKSRVTAALLTREAKVNPKVRYTRTLRGTPYRVHLLSTHTTATIEYVNPNN